MTAATTATVTEATTASTKGGIPNWKVTGDWFDVCKCNIPCPCEFAQTPTYGDCEGILAYNIKKGNYGETLLEDLNVIAVGSFKGNIWAGDAKQKWILHYFLTRKQMNSKEKH
jgi:hypothetical protein